MENIKIKLRGKSVHGKNRVRENGGTWSILDDVSMTRPGSLLIQSDKDPNKIRWVMAKDDPDFDVILFDDYTGLKL